MATTSSGTGATDQGPERPAVADTRVWRDEVFDLLSNHRRRYTLHLLKRRGEPLELGELAERVVAWENGTALHSVSAAERKRTYTALQQVHLPRLDEAGMVAFDDRQGVVELRPRAADLDLYLEVVEGRDRPWSHYNLALAGLNLGLLVAHVVGVAGLARVPSIAIALFAVTSLATFALAQAYAERTGMRLGHEDYPGGVDA